MAKQLYGWIGGGLALLVMGGLGVVLMNREADSTPNPKQAATRGVEQPEELGQVRWERDFSAALARGAQEDKPVLVLFDEVPGCHTVLTFGREVLSHPLLVEAAETLFVPVAVYNNVEGPDRAVLESFGEPTWNNPVVRVIGADRAALAPRLDRDWTVAGLAGVMVQGLEARGKEVPTYLRLLAAESSARREGTSKATFGMYCFWSGEAGLGSADGVVSTRTGFLGGREVVEVEYDPRVVGFSELARYAQKTGAGEVVFAGDDAELEAAKAVFGDKALLQRGGAVRGSSKDDKYQLIHTSWAHVPMTPLQATRANALLGSRREPAELFSPRQRALHAIIATHPDAGWTAAPGEGDLIATWRQATARAEALRSDKE